MTDRKHRSAKDLGSDSPASEEAAEQTRSGMQGAPRGKREAGGGDRQPPQSSGRSVRGPRPGARKHFDERERPGAQGEGSPSPARLSTSDRAQGAAGRPHAPPRVGRGEDEATED
jgi:hypothetical protein